MNAYSRKRGWSKKSCQHRSRGNYSKCVREKPGRAKRDHRMREPYGASKRHRGYHYMFPNAPDRASAYGVRHGAYGGSSGNDPTGLTLEDIERICSERYGNSHRAVVITLARYSLKAVREMVDRNYEYWHHYSKNDVDLFWLGYYIDEHSGSNATPFRLSSDGDACTIGFDTRQYVDDIKKLSSLMDHSFGHAIGYLICDYYDNRIHFEKSVFVNLGHLIHSSQDYELIRVTDCLFSACVREQEARNVGTIIKNELNFITIKRRAADTSGDIIAGAGVLLQFFGL